MKNIIIGIDFSKETFDATVLDLSKTNGVLPASINGMHKKFLNSKRGEKHSFTLFSAQREIITTEK